MCVVTCLHSCLYFFFSILFFVWIDLQPLPGIRAFVVAVEACAHEVAATQRVYHVDVSDLPVGLGTPSVSASSTRTGTSEGTASQSIAGTRTHSVSASAPAAAGSKRSAVVLASDFHHK